MLRYLPTFSFRFFSSLISVKESYRPKPQLITWSILSSALPPKLNFQGIWRDKTPTPKTLIQKMLPKPQNPNPKTQKSVAFHTLAYCPWHSERIPSRGLHEEKLQVLGMSEVLSTHRVELEGVDYLDWSNIYLLCMGNSVTAMASLVAVLIFNCSHASSCSTLFSNSACTIQQAVFDKHTMHQTTW